jgi:glycosyltransferase involved in cell wall biosynthesis
MQSNKTKLLIITNLYPTPWAPNRASFNRQQFERLSVEMTVKLIVLVPFPEWIDKRKQCKNSDDRIFIPFFYTPKFGRRFYPVFQIFSLLFCLRKIKMFDPQAILASWGYPDAVAVSLLNRLLRKPLFIKIHGSDINENTKFKARTKQIVKSFNNAKKIFSVSEALKNVLVSAGVNKSKVLVNYNGVDKSIFYPCDKKVENKIVFVGNLIKEKGIVELLDAASSLGAEYKQYQFRIIGQGPLGSSLISKYDTASNNVKFLGSLPLTEVAEEIRQATLLVLPSYREGVPNVILEALSSGTPVVATNVGGIAEVLSTECGIVIEHLDDLEGAIKEALSRKWSGEKIVNHAKTFDWDKNVSTVIDTIQNELGKHAIK